MRIFGAVLGAGLLLISLAPAAAQDIAMSFRVFTGGLHALDAHYQAAIGAERYRVTAQTHTMGLLDDFFKWRSTTVTRGRLEDGGFKPLAFNYVGENRMGRRQIDVDFAAPKAPMATVVGSGKYEDDSKGPRALLGLPIDLMTALTIGLLDKTDGDNLCAPAMDVFTGTRRSNVYFEYLGPEYLKRTAYGAYEGETIKCRMHYDRLIAFVDDYEKAQQEQREENREEKPKASVLVWIARHDKMGINVPVLIQAESHYGTALVHLAKFQLDDQIKLVAKDPD